MTTAINMLCLVMALVSLLPAVYLLVLTVAALRRGAERKGGVAERLPSIAVVIPAHNEGLLIRSTVEAVFASRYPADRYAIFVIADNCTDGTAAFAESCGARVAVRQDTSKRGKGHAIDWFLKAWRGALEPFEVIALIDADTVMDRAFLELVGREIGSGRARVVQGYYGVANIASGWRASLSEAAFAVSHHLRPLGRNRLGATAGLKGNGMAFSADLLLERGWPAHSLVEDLEFALLLLEDGIRVQYLPGAKVYAEMVTDRKAAGEQRIRWEGGRVRMISQLGGRLLRKWSQGGDPALLEAWMDLVCPPLGLYVGVLLSVLAMGWVVGSPAMEAAGFLGFAVMAGHVLVALWHRGVSEEVWRALLQVPLFLVGKIPVYLHLALRGPGDAWVRTQRNGEGKDSRYQHYARTGKGKPGTWRRDSVWRLRAWSWTVQGAEGCKRFLDICGALGALALLGPVMLVTAILIKLEDGGPVLFRQTRVGKYGRRIQIYKFRSMVQNAEKVRARLDTGNHHGAGVTFKMRRDPRVTKMGRWIRKFSIDEIPQFINVLNGDMSLVGPRPALPKEVACYDAFQLRRLIVKPGISCLWQIQGRADIDFEGQVRLDLQYIHSGSVWQDIMILLKTVPAVVLAPPSPQR